VNSASSFGEVITAPNRKQNIAEVFGKSKTDAANARLIASAPDLLDALRWALGQVDDDLCPDGQEALNAAYAALDLAEGRTKC